jgi:WD40 repeat protein
MCSDHCCTVCTTLPSAHSRDGPCSCSGWWRIRRLLQPNLAVAGLCSSRPGIIQASSCGIGVRMDVSSGDWGDTTELLACGVQDVAWHAHHRDVFGSAGSDKQLILWDTRKPPHSGVQCTRPPEHLGLWVVHLGHVVCPPGCGSHCIPPPQRPHGSRCALCKALHPRCSSCA